jgi:4-diphosphocytidyl-2-C-methyl-D-erythritol kinase
VVTVTAPAKINLTLEVLRKRPDGYHEIKSVLQAISLCDTLILSNDKDVIFQSDRREWMAEKSLLSRTLNLLIKLTGYSKGVSIDVRKRIPMMSGLGGDSSDAAALLRGLDELWGLAMSPEALRELAVQLGSDVSFFLDGGTALAERRGEIIKRLRPLSRIPMVLVVPDISRKPGKTGRVYASLRPEHFTDGGITEKLVESLHKNDFSPSLLFNTFENIADNVYPGLNVYREHFIKMGAPHVHLAGSGPTLFAMFQDKDKARDLYIRCKDQGMETYLVETL